MAYFDPDTASAYAAGKSTRCRGNYREHIDASLESMGILEQAVEMRQRNALMEEMPGRVGAPADARRHASSLHRSDSSNALTRGQTSLVLVPPPDKSLAMPSEICDQLMRFLQ